MKIPGSEHPITLAANPHRVQVTFAGKVIADITRALTLREAGYPPVQYIPRQNVNMSALTATTHSSHCPYKGDASYFSLSASGRRSENAVWSYQQPFPAMREIAGYVAFYPSRVDRIEELPA